MKVLFISSYYGTAEGGADISTKLLAEGLPQARVQVEIASINVHSCKDVHSLFTYYPLPTKLIAFLLNTPLLDSFLTKRLIAVVKKMKPDVLHVHDLMLLPAAVQVVRKIKVPIIVTVRDLRFVTNIPLLSMDDLSHDLSSPHVFLHYLAKQKGWIAALVAFPFIFSRPKQLRKALRQTSAIVAISQFVKKQLLGYDIPRKKVIVIYNPAPTWEQMEKRKRKDKILFFAPGRIEYYKGFHLLIHAMKELTAENCSLLIAGEGPEEKKLHELVKRLGLTNVVFLGKLSYEKIKRYYALCDVVLFPSLWPEPLGRIPLEAMAAGKPCIATDVGGIGELVPRKYLVKPTAQAFAEKMKKIIQAR